jgi:tetratricopeptide (TPR) repeat protein
MRTGQVFVSHTSDMARFPAARPFVRATLDAVARAGMAPVDMRYFAARDDWPADYCQARVRDCEVYIAVVGFRYGSIVPGQAVSYTELEFEAASAAGLPRLVFLLEETAAAAAGSADADPGPVQRFRQRLREAGVIVRGFTTADGLELEAFHALRELPASLAVPQTLPRDIASFTGRELELAGLASAAGSDGVVGIQAIGGMAGIGKTTFAVHAAHQLAPGFPDGQIFLPLHGHTPGQRPAEPADALASLLLTTGVSVQQIPPGLEARAALWRDRMAGRKLLLVLDDAAGSEQVRPLLPGASGSLVLVTSRRHLTALDAAAITLGTLGPGQAARLLVRLADRPGLSPDDAAVGDIARLCGYLPLAVGMLARQLHHHPSWTPAGLAEDLAAARDRLELMVTENLSVAAAFDLSYADLTAGQQQLFRHLGLHPGTDIDAYAAAALDGTSLAATRRALGALYDQYLLTEPGSGRYRLHDLIREHAHGLADREDTGSDRDQATGRLLDYYQHAAATADRHLTRYTRPGPPPGMASLAAAPDQPVQAAPSPADLSPADLSPADLSPADLSPADVSPAGVSPAGASPGGRARGASSPAVPDLPDYRRALAWARAERANLLSCLDHATWGGQRARVVTLTAAIAALLRHDGPWTESITRHATAAQAARHLGDRLGEASALHDLGVARRLTGDYPGATEALETALSISCDLSDRQGQANALTDLAVARRETGDYPGAAETLETALDIYRDLGDRLGQANALSNLGIARYLTGDFPAAVQALEAGLDIYRALGDRQGQANALSNLGIARYLTGDFPAAAQILETALDISRDIGDRQGQASALNNLGETRRLTGDLAGAAQALEAALDISRDLGNRLGQATTLTFLGSVRRLTGDYPGATEALEAALSISRDLGDRLGQGNALCFLGVTRRLTGDYPGATEALEAALSILRDLGDRGGEAETLNEAGTLHRFRGDLDQAVAYHRQALDLARVIDSPWDEAQALAGLGRCALAADRPADAQAGLRQAAAIFRRIGAAEASGIAAELDAFATEGPAAH